MKYLVGGVAIVEVLGAPIDIFNLVMMYSSNSTEIASGWVAPLLNWIFLGGNSLVMLTIGVFYILLLWEKVNGVLDILGPALMALVINFPGLLMLYTQINALLYISEVKNGQVSV